LLDTNWIILWIICWLDIVSLGVIPTLLIPSSACVVITIRLVALLSIVPASLVSL
jgi:hypothetical protein